MSAFQNLWVVVGSGRFRGGAILRYYSPPPTESHRLLETTENFCYYPPPPLNRVDMALHTKGGPLFRKILDLRLVGPIAGPQHPFEIM